MRVFVTGGTGLIGARLVRRLLGRQDSVLVLSRRPSEARLLLGTECIVIEGDPMNPGAWMDAAGDCDAVVHLAGENVFAHRWNAAVKQMLRDSRIKSTNNVVH